jgi:S1-C subfamily serine protease
VKHPHHGAAAAVLGYPENGPYSVASARFGDTSQVISQDAYGRGPVQRTISSLRADVRSGNSGGPVVDARGRVLGTVFAATTSGAPGGFAVPNSILDRALGGNPESAVDTGPCTA